jgi:hypothetical protein
MTMDYAQDRIKAIQYILGTLFAAQKALQTLAPDFKWAGMGNLLGDFGELVAIDKYGLTRAPRSTDGYDALTSDGKKVQIKTNYSANQIGFRGKADLMLVIKVSDDGSWEEVYYGSFKKVKELARYSARDNKNMIAISKLKSIQESPIVQGEDMPSSYWVYENFPNNHARIHLGSCSFCNEGKGTHNHPGTGPTSRWHGPYGSYLKAE